MLKNILLVGLLSSLLTFGLFGHAFAESTDPSLLGNDEFQFDAPETKADRAARDFDYDKESLALVGTEAGDWDFKSNATQTKSDIAARDYQYSQTRLASVGTEAGDWEYRHEPSGTQMGAAVANEIEAVPVCSDC
jgi:hypothetical protein